MKWYFQSFKKYFDFKGRARRKEYWYFIIFSIIIGVVVRYIDIYINTAGSDADGALTAFYITAVLIPGWAVSVRRLHDTGSSGWWLLFLFILFIGPPILLVMMALDSEQGRNKYGPNPKEKEIRKQEIYPKTDTFSDKKIFPMVVERL
jgi:uncharacterized membrane protein YhaH (DUF805 family)